MNFGQALEKLKVGERVMRADWEGKRMWLALVKPEDGLPLPGLRYELRGEYEALALMPAPWIGMATADSKFVPWLACQADLLAEDWELVHRGQHEPL